MIIVNIALVLLGIAISFGTAFFWSKTAKMLNRRFEIKSSGSTILARKTAYKLVKSLHQHKSKFKILMVAIVTIIEFLALLQF